MKPVELNRVLECDDGIFNYKWHEEHPKLKNVQCEWMVMGGGGVKDGKLGEFWCVTCGLVMCKKHRKGHKDSAQHRFRIEKWKAEKN